MGYARWNPSDWKDYASATAARSTDDIFKSRDLKAEFDPSKITVRESRDSAENPQSTAIIIACDVTGSMGSLADNLVRKGIGTAFEEILKRLPVTDPHLMVMGVGDVRCDRAPLQATQFEADLRIAAQLEEIYIEHGGGGNCWESYNLPWYFAAQKTALDCFEKRGKKGYLFTVGDEQIPEDLTRDDVKRAMGLDLQMDRLANRDLLTMVGRQYEVFHLMVEEGSHYRSCGAEVRRGWTELLGQRAIPLSDHTKLSEVIVSTIEVAEGRDKSAVAASWGGDTSLVVAHAVGHLHTGLAKPKDGGVIRF
ncbi:MAG: hypothetical protein JSS81_03065 [Acidobacteria bacterium]|nr:hypothetical protein [Acidobacteriota bacterium]